MAKKNKFKEKENLKKEIKANYETFMNKNKNFFIIFVPRHKRQIDNVKTEIFTVNISCLILNSIEKVIFALDGLTGRRSELYSS